MTRRKFWKMNRRSSYATSKDIPADDDEGFRFRRSRTGSAWDRHYTVPDYDLAEKRYNLYGLSYTV